MNSQSNASDTMELLRNNFERHYKSNKAPFGIYFHAAWFVITENSENFSDFNRLITISVYASIAGSRPILIYLLGIFNFSIT